MLKTAILQILTWIIPARTIKSNYNISMDYCVGKGWCLSEGDRLLEQESKPMPQRSEQNGKGNISLLNFFQDCLGFHLDILWFNKQRFLPSPGSNMLG